MKKVLRIISITVLLLLSFNMVAFAAPPLWAGGHYKNKEIKQIWKQYRKEFKGIIKLNGKPIKFDVKPYELNGRILIPLRAIAATLKAEVTYKTDGTKQEIIVEKNDDLVKIVMGRSSKDFSITINGKEVGTDIWPELRNGRTFVPLRLLATLLGLKVNYNGDVELDEEDPEDQLEEAESLPFRWYDFTEKNFEADVRVIEGKLNKENRLSSLKFAVLNNEEDKEGLDGYSRRIPKLDYQFDRYLYIWGLGKANTGGYNLYISEVSQLGKVVWVKVHLVTPGKDDIVTQAITYSFDLIRIRKDDFINDGKLTFIFLDQNNKELGKVTKAVK